MPRKKREEDSPNGFQCPDCKIGLEVVNTTRTGKGIVRRVRVCRVCGHIERTEERSKGRLPATNGTH